MTVTTSFFGGVLGLFFVWGGGGVGNCVFLLVTKHSPIRKRGAGGDFDIVYIKA